ncbi:uncharacterized protein [Primulina eburnea]|uniref:uncharacterized protein n=1 Tax=Primulina eburnea TaxID=1245227 RepID=UPI003C6CBD38
MSSFNSQIQSLLLTLFITALLIFARPLSSSAALESSPAPQPSGDDISPPSPSPSPSPSLSPSPSPSPIVFSPPAPTPSDLSPPPASQAPAPGTDEKKSPTPAPAVAGDVNQRDVDDMESNEESSGGMSGPKKAGIALGVIAGVCIVGFSGFVYKKRQQNLRRSHFGSAARRDFL